MVLRHLSERAASEEDAQTLVRSNLVQSDLLVELLKSPDEKTSNVACWIVGQLTLPVPIALEIGRIKSQQLALKERRIERHQKAAKILLLGTSESGKSTILKQMKIIHQAGFDERERAEYRMTIYENVLDYVGTLARFVRRVGVESLPEKVREHAEVLLRAFSTPSEDNGESSAEMETESAERGNRITAIDSVDVGADPVPSTDMESNMEMETESVESGSWITACESVDEGSCAWTGSDGEYHGGMPLGRMGSQPPGTSDVLAQMRAVLTPALVNAVWHIWRAPVVNHVADEPLTEFYVLDNAGYFFSSIHRIADSAYVPNEQDILHARTRTTAITETRFRVGKLPIHLFDVGGVRSERKKWIHCFEGVTGIIFCAALDDYDQMLVEDRWANRLRESLVLFESVINSRWFLRTTMILFLNKIDVLKKKLPRIPLEHYFPEYEGGNDIQKAAKYFLWKFIQQNRAKLSVYPHLTQATNTKNIRLVHAAVNETIMQNALKNPDSVYATLKEKIKRNTLKYTEML
ncbi:guanine nucleotide binding protein, alpha subunit [Mycena galopus ATCC 62051]|nr:guanine nucleotide binding protein, alpha subunit [Mycena galopus ATCC 62051]